MTTKQCSKPNRQSGPQAEKILRAARKLFLTKGYHCTTIRDICALAKLSNGSLYFHFHNKHAIYARIYEECFDFLNNMLARAVHPAMPPLEQIETVLKTYVRYFIEHREMWDMLDISFLRVGLPGELINRFNEKLKTSFGYVQEAVQAHLEKTGYSGQYDSHELAILLITSIDGLFYNLKQGFFDDGIQSLTLEQLADTQIAIFKTYLMTLEQEH